VGARKADGSGLTVPGTVARAAPVPGVAGSCRDPSRGAEPVGPAAVGTEALPAGLADTGAEAVPAGLADTGAEAL
jgi:hypothetical protein